MLEMSAMRRIGPSYGSVSEGASARDIVRALRAVGVSAQAFGTPLEVQTSETVPRLETATPVEGSDIAVRAVTAAPVAGFGAFLDGIQRSQVVAHVRGVPLVQGAVAAAIRLRVDRKLRSWTPPLRSRALYAPVAALPPEVASGIAEHCTLVDTLEDDADLALRHPADLAARALTAIQRARESAELDLAERWCARGEGTLLVDGGIAGRERVALSPWVVGAVKSHRTLYVSGDALPLIFGLREGERTTAVVLASPRRRPVATWYLRLRNLGARGPLAGLVRLEVALDDPATVAARADLVSRWMLAERAPVALPDARWDVMVYGIHECEQYLSAILQ